MNIGMWSSFAQWPFMEPDLYAVLKYIRQTGWTNGATKVRNGVESGKTVGICQKVRAIEWKL
jgi:hypothetical protein